MLPAPLTNPIIIDPLAFTVALVGSPLLVAVFGFWALLIPVVGLVLGGPIYLALGVPILMWFIPRFGIQPLWIALLAALSSAVACTLGLAAMGELITHRGNLDEIAGLYLLAGTPLAFVWGLVFALLYPKFERAPYRALNALPTRNERKIP